MGACGFVEGSATFGAREVISFEFVSELGVGEVAGNISQRAVATLESGTVLHINDSAIGCMGLT